MEPMLTIPVGVPGLESAAGGYREHDILVVNETGATNITGFGYGPEANTILA
jgi:creatinase